MKGIRVMVAGSDYSVMRPARTGETGLLAIRGGPGAKKGKRKKG